MHVIADLQIHSKYSRATSKKLNLTHALGWAMRKGIGLLATGDWSHPLWMREIEANLEENGTGLLQLKKGVEPEEVLQSPVPYATSDRAKPQYLLATEVSCIFSQGGKGRRVHTLIWVPTIASAQKINREMTKQGCNLMSDGRPIIGLSSIQVADLVFNIEPKALVIPAHAWTPWFSTFGSMSGFDSIEEAFGKFAPQIYAIETGLSSSPDMNWRITELDNRSIISCSDAHSGAKFGREATVFHIPDGKLTYDAIYEAIKGSSRTGKPSIAYTIEFYPEEGKYHYTGHRNCKIRLTPEESREQGVTCSVCGKGLTQGVMQRVEELAGRSEESLKLDVKKLDVPGVSDTIHATYSNAFPDRPPFVMIVPLQEIIAEAIGSPFHSPKVYRLYEPLTRELGGEFQILMQADTKDIARIAGERVAEGVRKVRARDIVIDPGYDGVFGVVKLWREEDDGPLVDNDASQLSMFSD